MKNSSIAVFLIGLSLLVLLPLSSRSQLVWQRQSQSPVLPAWSGDLEDPSNFRYTHSPAVVMEPNGLYWTYRMWFGSRTFDGSSISISYAASTNGKDWFVSTANPVLRTGPAGSFDSRWVTDPFVLKEADQYVMYYTGHDGSTWRGGKAVSSDGLHWEKSGRNPLFDVIPGTWESQESGAASKVLQADGISIMAYTGYDGSRWNIGIARSQDGSTWERDPHNPVLTPGTSQEWDAQGVMTTGFFVRDSVYYLLYSAPPLGSMGIAWSRDLVTWKKYPGNPVLLPDQESWDQILGLGSVHVAGNDVKFWYTAKSNYPGSGLDRWQIGYAKSPLQLDSVLHADTVLGTPEIPGLPQDYRLQSPFPNPFNPGTSLAFDVPRRSNIRITVFDVAGREVARLVDGEVEAGQHRIQWDSHGFASGSYFVRMEADRYRQTRSVVLIK